MGIKAIIIAVVALAVVGGGVYYVTNKNDEQQNTETQASEQENGGPATIKDLLAQNKNTTCTFSSTDESGNQTSGTVYVAGERMKGDISYQASGEAEQKSSILRDSEYQYYWQEGSNAGFKTKISEVESAAVEGQENENNQNQPVDQNTEYEFDCSDWNVDESVLSVPENVEFTDFSSQVEQSRQLRDEACASIENATARKACEQAAN